MAEYRTVRMSFWHDPFVEELEAKGKLLYLYLFTGPYANNLGIVEATRRKIAYETALSLSEVDKYLSDFEEMGKVVCDPEHNLIFLTNFIKHQSSTSPKIIDNCRKIIPYIQSPIIAKALCIRYPEIYGVDLNEGDTVSIPYADGMCNLIIPTAEFGSWKLELGKGKREVIAPSGAPDCPHEKIREMYHEMLPELPKAMTWGEERRKLMRSRWRETWERLRTKGEPHDVDDLLEWWRRYFALVRASPFLMGKVVGSNGKPFFADLEWLVKPTNYAKVLDQKYVERRPAA